MEEEIDYGCLAAKLIALYPKGFIPGSMRPYAAGQAYIANHLKRLFTEFPVTVSEAQIIEATKAYVSRYQPTTYKWFKPLHKFIISGSSSLLLDIIENGLPCKEAHFTKMI